MSITDLTQLTEKTIAGLRIHGIEDAPATYNILIYGEPGAGKTVFAGSASALEQFSPVLFLDVEGGTLSLHATYPKCDVVRVKTWGEVAKLYEAMYDHKGGGYKTLVVDSLSEVGKFCMTQVMIECVKQNADREFDVPGMREWGITLERMRRFIRGFRDLEGVNTIMTAHIRTEKLENNLQKNYPALNGQLMREAAGFFDFVFYLYTLTKVVKQETSTERLLMTAPNGKYIAKDRSGRLPQIVDNPSMAVVMDLILGTNNAKHETRNDAQD